MAARSMNDCIGDGCFDGRSYMLSVKIMSGAFCDLVAGSRVRVCGKERTAKPPQTFENEYRAIERSREGFDVVQMFQNISCRRIVVQLRPFPRSTNTYVPEKSCALHV